MKDQDNSHNTQKVSIVKEQHNSLRAEEAFHYCEELMKSPERINEELYSGFRGILIHTGLVTLHDMLQLEVTGLCGEIYKHGSGGTREYRRVGADKSRIKICGQSVSYLKPRVRRYHKGGRTEEYHLKTPTILKGLLKGMSEEKIAKHIALGTPLNKFDKDGKPLPSEIVHQFIHKWKEETEEAMNSRDLSKDRYIAIFVDTIYFGGHGIECAFGINDKGEKCWLGMMPSSTKSSTKNFTEKSEVVSQLLDRLIERGLSKKETVLFIVDGSKATRKGIVDVFGDKAVFQHSHLHKLRNITLSR